MSVSVGNGTTAGKLRTNADLEYQIGGKFYRKASTDDLWDLSAEVDTIAAKYRAYRLYLDSSGTASFEASDADQASEALAIADLPAETSTKCPVAVFVAGPVTDFDDAGGLSAQGTLYDGRAISVSDPDALTSATTTLITA